MVNSSQIFFFRIIEFPLKHLSKTSHDVVKRWVNEAQEAVNSDNVMVQVGENLSLF